MALTQKCTRGVVIVDGLVEQGCGWFQNGIIRLLADELLRSGHCLDERRSGEVG